MIEHRGTNRGSIITGSSVHNCRVERPHCDIYSGVVVFYALIFEELEDEGCLDPLQDGHIFCSHNIFIPRINNFLQELVGQMNRRPVSSEISLQFRCGRGACWKICTQTTWCYQKQRLIILE